MGQNRESRILKQIVVLILSILVIAAMTLPALGVASAAMTQALEATPGEAETATPGEAEKPEDTPSPSPSPTPAPTNELDGSKIESITLSWVTQDSTMTAENELVSEEELADTSHLYLASTGPSSLSMMYKVVVELTGQYDYAPGDVTITVPAKVWHARSYVDTNNDGETEGVVDENRMIGTLELPFPAAPSTKAYFNWQIIGDNYVITNTRTLSSTTNISFEGVITGLRAMDVVDMSECDPITVRCEVTTNQGNIIEMTSDSITAQIDTQARINTNGIYLRGEVFEDYPGLSAALLAQLPEGANPNDYVYVRWDTYHSHTNNQPYSLDIAASLPAAYERVNGEIVHKADGIFLGSTSYSGTFPAQNEFKAEIGDHLTSTNTGWQYAQTVYMWSAYPKDKFYVPKATEPQRVYYLSNDVKWLLTESDAANDGDAQKVTEVSRTATVTYAPVQWKRPVGVFGVDKYTYSTYYGKNYRYGYALSLLDNGQEADMRFVLRTGANGYLWTTAETQDYSYGELSSTAIGGPLEDLELDLSEFGKLGWKQVTYDYQTFFNHEEETLTSEDFRFKSLQVTVPTKRRYGKNTSGAWGYISDSTLPTPDLVIEYQLDNDETTWYHAATAVWGEDGTGAFSFKDVNEEAGVTTSGMTVYFPENATDVRHSYVSNVFNGKTAEKSDIAGINWYTYPTITMKPSPRVQEIVAGLFEQSDTPSTKFKNDVGMDAYGWVDGQGGEQKVVTRNFDYSMATLEGASYGVSLSPEYDFSNDAANQRVTLHYKVTLSEQSDLTSRSDYDAAVAAGAIPAETSGVWYDLLPPKVVPLTDTVKLRNGDTINNVYTIENYRNTGRTLLVVEAELTPVPVYNNDRGWADRPQLTFDAVYTWLDMNTYGLNPVNYAAFESTTQTLRKNTLGTITNQKGEPDNPVGGNNATTPVMPPDVLAAMTDLDPTTNENRFVYGTDGGTSSNGGAIVAPTVSLSDFAKGVKSDLVGLWTQGLVGEEQATVYEGQSYTYRMLVTSKEGMLTEDIVMYDALESYVPQSDPDNANKTADWAHNEARKDWTGDWAGKGQWRGTLEQVDLSELVSAGVKPVLLYSLVDVQFDDSDGQYTSGAYDISDGTIWQVAPLDESGRWTVQAGLNVKAVAVDATKAADGSDFVLEEEQSLAAYLKMRAPDDNGDANAWNAKGAYARVADENGYVLDDNGSQQIDWDAAKNAENNMYAYNDARVRLSERKKDAAGDNVGVYRIQRDEYTRVGIVPSSITVEKVWQDQNDHDGKRPEEVTIHVLRRLAGVGSEAAPVLDADNQPLTAVLSEETGWKAVFRQLDIVNDDGVRWLYTFEEEPVEGYESKVEFVSVDHYIMTNVHPNEQVTLAGVKEWNDNGDELGLRPQSITLSLYRDEALIATRTVTPDSTDAWTYSFGVMDKYAPGGREYAYRIEEGYVPKYQPEYEGYAKVINAYAPFGDLEVSKTVTNTTQALKDRPYGFTLVLLQEAAQGEEARPVDGEFDYEILEPGEAEGSWTKVSGGKIASGGGFALEDGQKLIVRNLPSESRYQLIETEEAGFASKPTNEEGVIRSGRTAYASFENVYTSSGSMQLSLEKTLTGRSIRKNQFVFELVDMNAGSETYNQVIRTANVNAAKTTTGGKGTQIRSESDAVFGQVSYTQADDGKTFYYLVREVDRKKPGFATDTKVYNVAVTVEDNGDGTLTATPAITDAQGTPCKKMIFENRYTSIGSLTLTARKTLTGRALTEGEFTFDLYAYDKENGTQENPGTLLQSVTNKADGSVEFEPIVFDQDDVSLNDSDPATHTYLIRERKGTDHTVIYSEQEYVINVRVYDNGDGTMSFAQDQQTVSRSYETCEACEGKGGYPDPYGKKHFLRWRGNATVIGGLVHGMWSPGVDFCSVCRGLASVNGSQCGECMGTGLMKGGSVKWRVNTTTAYTIDFKVLYYVEATNKAGWLAYTEGVNSRGTRLRRYFRTVPEWLTPYIVNCEACDNTGEVEGELEISGEAATPVFANQLKPGALAVKKTVPSGKGNPDNPDQTFTFHVKLTGVPDGTYTCVNNSPVSSVDIVGGELTFELLAGKTLTIIDLPASASYEVWEDTPVGWVLTSKSNTTGVIQPLVTSTATFTNEYDPGRASVTLRASKLMDGAGAAADAFSFTLSKGDEVLQTKANGAGGSVMFDAIEYNGEDVGKEYTYTIAEVPGDPNGTIAYDAAKYDVTVALSEDNGVLIATVTYPGENNTPPVFRNTTKPGNLTIGMNTLNATQAASGQAFKVHLHLTDTEGAPWSGSVKIGEDVTEVSSDGLIELTLKGGETATIKEIPAGLRYQITEPQTLPGWTMDTAKTGAILSNDTVAVQLTNTYSLTGVASLGVTKKLVGRTLTEDEFTFELFRLLDNNQEESLGTAKNAADGSVTFADIAYTGEGTHTYFVRELRGIDATIDYSGEIIQVTVKLEDQGGAGKLTASATYQDATTLLEKRTITNAVKPGALTIGLTVNSIHAAHAQQAFTFTVHLTDKLGEKLSGTYDLADGRTLPVADGVGTLTLKHGESVTINGLPDGAGYRVEQAAAAGFTQTGSGASGTIAANEIDTAAFVNTYHAEGQLVLTAHKTLKGRDLTAGEFEFVLTDVDGYELDTATNDVGGNVAFEAISYTEADAGTKTYRIMERNKMAPGMTYDPKVYEITVTVTDLANGVMSAEDSLGGKPAEFENTYSNETSVTVNKVWQDNNDALGLRPQSITVELLRNNAPIKTAELTAASGWTYTFEDLLAFDGQGIDYSYAVRELPVPGYNSTKTTANGVTTITNTVDGALSVSKTVATGDQQKAFTFHVALAKDGAALAGPVYVKQDGATSQVTPVNGTVTLALKHGESALLFGLPVGTAYRVEEEDDKSYTAAAVNAQGVVQRYADAGAVFTNTLKTTTFTVEKRWQGGSGVIELTLYANGEKLDPQPEYERTDDLYRYTDLPMYTEEGEFIVYGAKEKYWEGFVTIYSNIEPYQNETSMVYDGGTIINKEIVEPDFRVKKVWNGLEKGEKAPEITLVLYCNGVATDVKTPKPDGSGWYKYYDLPNWVNGERAVYTVQEEYVTGYATRYELADGTSADYADNGGTIVNSKLPPTGDNSRLGLWMALAALSLMGVCVLAPKNRKHSS